MKITLNRPVYIDAESGVQIGAVEMADEKRAKALIARGLATEGAAPRAKAKPVAKAKPDTRTTRAVAGAPKTRSRKA